MSKTAFIYPGQGVQTCGMGKDFYENSPAARQIFDQASEVLKLDMKALCFEKNDLLDQTEYTQAALVTTYLAMTRVLLEKGIRPDVTAGLSLGEYAAIAVSGALEDLDAIRLVRKRGILMQNTVPAGEGAMCAVLSMDEKKIEEVLENYEDVTIANYNCPGQIVITGSKAGVEQAEKALKEQGAKRTVMLNVSGPFHSPLLQPAKAELEAALDGTQIRPLQIPYVTNVTAKQVTQASEIRGLLVQQLCSPVKWMQSMEQLIKDGTDIFVEIGPGKTLTGFMRKINRNSRVYHISSWEEMEQVVCELGQAGKETEC